MVFIKTLVPVIHVSEITGDKGDQGGQDDVAAQQRGVI